MWHRFPLLLVAMVSAWSVAAADDAVVSVKPGSAVVTTNPLVVVLGLLFVVLLIFALAWLLRRAGNISLAGGQSMKVLSALSVGPRERVVLIDVAGKQLLLGVAPGRVSTLQSFDEPVIDTVQQPSVDFSSRMKQVLQQQGLSK